MRRQSSSLRSHDPTKVRFNFSLAVLTLNKKKLKTREFFKRNLLKTSNFSFNYSSCCFERSQTMFVTPNGHFFLLVGDNGKRYMKNSNWMCPSSSVGKAVRIWFPYRFE